MRLIAISAVLLLLALPLCAGHAASFYIVPVAGHLDGAGGSVWRTDVSLHNFQTEPVTIEMALIETGEGLTDNVFPVAVGGAASVTLPAGTTRVLGDVLSGHRGRSSASGAIVLAGDRPFVVSSRSYALSPGGSTFGQTVTPVHEFVDNSVGGGGTTAFIPGVMATARQRTNLGFLAGAAAQSAGPLVVEVAIRSSDGSALGSRRFSVPAGAFSHLQVGTRELTNAVIEGGSASFRIVSGTGSIAGYASVIDNDTHAGSFINATAPVAVTGASSAFRSILSTR
jgi:hypothetical protein